MTLKELIEHTRCAILRDEAKPFLWSDATLLRYLNQGQVEFASRTHNIIDDTTEEYTVIETVDGQSVYDLSPKLLAIDEAGIAEYEDGALTNYTRLHDRTRNQLRRRFNSGRPCFYTAQVRTNAIRLDPTPDAVYRIEMVVARKPAKDLKNPQDVPEIEEQYHIYLCDFAAYMALVNNDPEGANMAAANTFKAKWDLTIRDAKRAMSRLRAGESPRARVNWTGKVR